MKLSFLISVILFTANISWGQADDTTYNIPKWAIYNSSYEYYNQIDSFLKAGDSADANVCYLKLSPYFLIRLFPTSVFLEKSFVECQLTAQTRDSVRSLYNATINTERTEPYKTFEKMYAEDQATRWKCEQCGDTFTCRVYEQRMNDADSVHSKYLYNYVRNNGWPTLEQGSMYAQLLAHHDMTHINYYLPELKKAVLNGNASLTQYYATLNRAKPSNLAALKKYKTKTVFDVSYVLRGMDPSSIQQQEMAKFVKDCGPIKHLYFVYESTQKSDFKKFLDDGFKGNYGHAWDIIADMAGIQGGHVNYDFLYEEKTSSMKKLKLYLVY
jgi:hypothetical protein